MTDQSSAASDDPGSDGAVPLHRPGLTPPELPARSIPAHVACVMDGNGRWANARGLPRTEGHRVGESTMMDVIAGAVEIGDPDGGVVDVRHVSLLRPSFAALRSFDRMP